MMVDVLTQKGRSRWHLDIMSKLQVLDEVRRFRQGLDRISFEDLAPHG